MSRMSNDTPAVRPCKTCHGWTANLHGVCTACMNRADFGTGRDPRWRFRAFKQLECGEVVEVFGRPKMKEV